MSVISQSFFCSEAPSAGPLTVCTMHHVEHYSSIVFFSSSDPSLFSCQSAPSQTPRTEPCFLDSQKYVGVEVFDNFETNPSPIFGSFPGSNFCNQCGYPNGCAIVQQGPSSGQSFTSPPISTCGGAFIEFSAYPSGSSPCEEPDAGEEPFVEFSTDGGNTFQLLAQATITPREAFSYYCGEIPGTAGTATDILIRITQPLQTLGDTTFFDNFRIKSLENSC